MEYINGWTKEKVIKHVKENFKGFAFRTNISNGRGLCQYLTKDGKKCAVGLFIPDGHTAQNSEDRAIVILNQYPELSKRMPLNEDQMNKWQKWHDDAALHRHSFQYPEENTEEWSLDRQIDYILEFLDEN